ncbi:hypothetical protein K525DRAFT_170382, partial [Schizophyllum commune Loenen D]
MQTALSMADIRHVVAWDDTLRPCDLARLARVCRDWQDVAEAALWADLPDLTYLLKLMPRHLWSYAPKQRTGFRAEPRYLRLMRDLIPSDWTPALRKAALIRRLTINCVYMLSVYCFDDSSPELGDGPRISFVDSLHPVGSRISSLRPVITLLDRQPDADIPYLRHISQTPSLTSLCIVSVASKASFCRPISYDASAFGFLRTLRTVDCPALMVADIIRLAAMRLECVYFNFHGVVTATDLDLLVRAVCERCSMSTLQDLCITPDGYTEDDAVQHLAPLVHFKNLRLRFMNSNYAVREGILRLNRTTMHPTFAVPELRAAICADDVLTRGDLYNLCLVSRGFEAVAAPLLWENLDCLVPLLQLLSRDAWRMRPAEEIKDDSDVLARVMRSCYAHTPQLLRRPLRPRDWTEAFVRHSKFVRTITLAPGEILSYEAQIRILDCPPPDAPVLPRLRTLML